MLLMPRMGSTPVGPEWAVLGCTPGGRRCYTVCLSDVSHLDSVYWYHVLFRWLGRGEHVCHVGGEGMCGAVRRGVGPPVTGTTPCMAPAQRFMPCFGEWLLLIVSVAVSHLVEGQEI